MAVTVQEIQCKQALNRVQGMPFDWSLNPYRGCQHACIYCYARKTHRYLNLGTGRDFEQRLFAKMNIADQLAIELQAKRGKVNWVAVGTATDPYQPVEKKYGLTGQCLDVFCQAGVSASITTKGPLILHDLQRLQALNEAAAVQVNVTITTLDADLARWLEPGVAPPQRRLDVIRQLSKAGVKTSVFIAPVLPGITAQKEGLALLLRQADQAGASGAHLGVLRLERGVKDWYYRQLAGRNPHLLKRYQAVYQGGSRAPQRYQEQLQVWFQEETRRLGLTANLQPEPARLSPSPQQVTLPLTGLKP